MPQLLWLEPLASHNDEGNRLTCHHFPLLVILIFTLPQIALSWKDLYTSLFCLKILKAAVVRCMNHMLEHCSLPVCFCGDWGWLFLSNLLNLAWNLLWTHYKIEEGSVHTGANIYTWDIWNFMLSVAAIAHQVLYKTHLRVHRERYLGSCAFPFFMVVNWGGFFIFVWGYLLFCSVLVWFFVLFVENYLMYLSTSGVGRKRGTPLFPMFTCSG